jgi:hypothetical protein
MMVPDLKSGLKGNPVKIGSYPRSCTLFRESQGVNRLINTPFTSRLFSLTPLQG